MRLIVVALAIAAASPALADQPRWIAGTALGIKVCDAPASPLDTRCQYVRSGKLVADAVEPEVAFGAVTARVLPSSRFYHVRLATGQSGYVSEFDMQYHTTGRDPAVAAAKCRQAGVPQVGMTVEQVKATCWGAPGHVNRTTTANVVFDQLVYGSDRYVYMRDGVVESVQNSGRLR
jgi:hypothetical protein